MLRLDDLPLGAALPRVHPPSGDRRAGGRGAARADARRAAAVAAARPVADDHGPRAPPAAGGGAHGAVLVLHDITDLRRADQIRRDFVANVSHELRTPLTAIRGYVEALARTTDASRRAEPDGSSASSPATPERMERLVKDLLRLARLDAGQETLDIIACDTRSLVQARRRRRGAVASSRAVSAIEVAVGPGAEIAARRSRASCTMRSRNLVANAITYSPEHTTIRIDAGRRDGDRRSISVSDEGPGIPDEDLSRVFERFYRVDKSRARDPGGTGLGLAIVKHLIELHHGSVRAEHGPAGGTRVTITLPA